jgi:hypothetical protein
MPFKITSLTDRLPISKDDELVIVACPDPVGANDCIKIVRSVGEQVCARRVCFVCVALMARPGV